MSREKQIEEMARDLCDSTMCDLETFNNCRMPQGNCSRCQRVAKDLYNAGYRKQEWVSVDERLPNPYISVLVYMPGEAPHPTVSEGFLTKHGAWYAGGFDRLPDEVVMWKEMPEAPKIYANQEEINTLTDLGFGRC